MVDVSVTDVVIPQMVGVLFVEVAEHVRVRDNFVFVVCWDTRFNWIDTGTSTLMPFSWYLSTSGTDPPLSVVTWTPIPPLGPCVSSAVLLF